MLSGMKELGRISSVGRKITLIIAAMLTVLVFARIASAQVIDFEALHPGYETSYIQIPTGYMGFNWSNYFRGMTSEYRPGTGYEKGTIGGMCAYTSGHQNISMTTTDFSTFNFTGAYITAAWLNNEPVTVEGWRSNQCLYTESLHTSTSGPYWFAFNFQNIDTLWFKPINDPGNHHIVIDNITVTPEPVSAVLLGLGALVLRKRKLKS